ncbi:MAG: ribosome maturation factor RimP [Pseudomonadota bacterium]
MGLFVFMREAASTASLVWASAHFWFLEQTTLLTDRLTVLLKPEIERLGYEFVALEYVGSGANAVLRIFIDQDAGISLDDCEKVSNEVGAVLDVEDPIPGEYNLEVSSPGLDRPLTAPEHFTRYQGERIKIRMQKGFVGRRRLTGLLTGFENDAVVIDVDGEQHQVPFASVEMARLAPDYDAELRRK